MADTEAERPLDTNTCLPSGCIARPFVASPASLMEAMGRRWATSIANTTLAFSHAPYATLPFGVNAMPRGRDARSIDPPAPPPGGARARAPPPPPRGGGGRWREEAAPFSEGREGGAAGGAGPPSAP